MDNNIRINQYDSMSSTGPETPSPGSPAWSLEHSGVCKEKWAARCYQRTALGISPRISEPLAEELLGPDHPPEEDNGMSPEEDDDASMRYCGYGDDDVSVGEEEVSVGERACGVVGEEASHREPKRGYKANPYVHKIDAHELCNSCKIRMF
ncbi:hypothetical protein IV203_009692 [Nitzschia inconspicua]|uniref:Uncharacterized protein n=1 Tax=Nitzschia inconspicua TaxID=303405 RepID=A0A9K3KVD6_9STRA|nr:hypothetical protein IV203_009692 [Nitzschia inconspicua]